MFRFENPIFLWLLLLIPILALVRFWGWRQRIKKLRKFGDPTLLKELMPEAITVGQMSLYEDMSERKCLEQLNLKRSTYRSQLEKARKQLESEFGKFF